MSYAVEIKSMDQSAFFDLRGDASQLSLVLGRLGAKLPRHSHVVEVSKNLAVIRVGPRHLLFKCSLNKEFDIESRLEQLTRQIHVQSTCVSDLYRGILLTGEDILDVLAQITPVDLNKISPSTAFFTEVFRLGGFIICNSLTCVEIYIERSYYHYTLRRLLKCALMDDLDLVS